MMHLHGMGNCWLSKILHALDHNPMNWTVSDKLNILWNPIKTASKLVTHDGLPVSVLLIADYDCLLFHVAIDIWKWFYNMTMLQHKRGVDYLSIYDIIIIVRCLRAKNGPEWGPAENNPV